MPAGGLPPKPTSKALFNSGVVAPATTKIANGFSGADASIFCSSSSRTCLVQTHAVFMVTPSDITRTVSGAANYSLDGGEFIQGGLMVPERKVLTGWCPANSTSCLDTGLSEEWCWEYLAVVPMPADVKTQADVEKMSFPKTLTITPWLHDAATGGAVTVGAPIHTTFAAPILIAGDQKVPGGMKVEISQGLGFAHSPTSVCVGTGDSQVCRSSAHIVVIATTPDPTVDMSINGAFSLDGGETWRTDSGITLYESWFASKAAGTAPSGDGYWRVYQYDVDLFGTEALYGDICVRVQVQDTASHAWSMDEKCIAWCRTPGYIPPAWVPMGSTAWEADACPCNNTFYPLPAGTDHSPKRATA